MPGAGLWQAEVPEAKRENGVRGRCLWTATRAQRARTPNEGFFRARGGLPHTQPFAFPAEPGSLKSEWPARGDVEIVFYQKWIDARLTIKSIDPAANTALLNGAGARLDERGELPVFYRECARGAGCARRMASRPPKTGVLSYLAPRRMGSGEIVSDAAAHRCLLIVCEGCSDITVRGITFAETDYPLPDDGHIDPQAASTIRGTIRAVNSNDGVFEDCVIENAGGYALDLGEGCHRWRVVGNSLRHSGAGGVRIGETRPANPAGEITFTDNEIAHYGRIHAAGGRRAGHAQRQKPHRPQPHP